MNGDCEDALARLLPGEGDYLLLDSEVARRELQEELAGPNPDTALFREFVAVCHWCREALPERDSIHFCPFCGNDLRPSPCRECGEAMEARWQFCASCGAGVRD
jgi:predicted RNA-binding Zn-ribbon protein involved in translation (DUF1610 family)